MPLKPNQMRLGGGGNACGKPAHHFQMDADAPRKNRLADDSAQTWPDASFDAVSMVNTLSYADDTTKALSEVARVLRAGGRFSFSVSYVPNQTWKKSKCSSSSDRGSTARGGLGN